MIKEIICTVCPRGCRITVDGENNKINSIEGYGCKRGLEYAEAEFINPVRILTTLVKIEGKDNDLLPVRSNKLIPKNLIFNCVEEIKKVSVKLPIKMHDVIISNVCGTGVDIVATKGLK